jgi:hypothetical protein
MAQAPPSVRAQAAVLAMKHLKGRLDWDDFLQELPEGIRDDELVHEQLSYFNCNCRPVSYPMRRPQFTRNEFLRRSVS